MTPTTLTAAGLAHLAQYIWGDPNSPQLNNPNQVNYLLFFAQALQANGIDPATATHDQLYAAMQIANTKENALALTPDWPNQQPQSIFVLAPPAAAPAAQPVTYPAAGSGSTTGSGSGSGSATPKPRDLFDASQGLDYCAAFPGDPYCGFYYDLGGFAGAIGGPTLINNTTIIEVTGLLAADVNGMIDNALSGLWGAIVVGIDDVLADVVASVQTAVTSLGNAVKASWAWLSRLAGMILALLTTVIDGVLRGVVAAIQKIEEAIQEIKNLNIKPIVDVLQRVRQVILDIWKNFIVPFLVILQDIRRVLAILSIFHVKWAQKLDAKLADLERRITAPLLYVLSYVNAVSNWINLIIAANYLLQKSVFLNSLLAYVGEALNLQLNAMNQPADPKLIAASKASAVYPTPAQSAADLQQFLGTGTGALQPVITNAGAVFQQYANGKYS